MHDLGCYAMDERDSLLKQEEGVQLWQTVSPAGEAFLIRSLRTRDTWTPSSIDEATDIFEDEVAKSRDSAHVQKKLGSF